MNQKLISFLDIQPRELLNRYAQVTGTRMFGAADPALMLLYALSLDSNPPPASWFRVFSEVLFSSKNLESLKYFLFGTLIEIRYSDLTFLGKEKSSVHLLMQVRNFCELLGGKTI